MKPRKLIAAIPSLLVLAGPAAAEMVERVVAKVNGEIVTLSDFETRQMAAVQAARLAPGDVEPTSARTTPRSCKRPSTSCCSSSAATTSASG